MKKFSDYTNGIAIHVIDTHVHVSRNPDSLFYMPEEWVLSAMDKYGIDFCLVSNGECAECDHEQKLLDSGSQVTQEEALLTDIDFAKRNPGKIGLCVWIKPLTEGYTKELETIIIENRNLIYGIKLHPFHSNVAPDDKRVKPYLEMAQRLGLPVVSHTGSSEVDSPVRLYHVAEQYPDIPFVMVHMGLGTDNREALECLGKLDNLYGDTTWVPIDTTITAIEQYGSEKIMFGSDMPIDGADTYWYNKQGQPSMYREYFEHLHTQIGNTAYNNLMYKNACRVFHITI